MDDKRSVPEARALSRRDLEMGRMREIYLQCAAAPHPALTDEQLSASLTATLAAKPKGAGWWVFGYGSLWWNPIFPFADAKPALFQHEFCLEPRTTSLMVVAAHLR